MFHGKIIPFLVAGHLARKRQDLQRRQICAAPFRSPYEWCKHTKCKKTIGVTFKPIETRFWTYNDKISRVSTLLRYIDKFSNGLDKTFIGFKSKLKTYETNSLALAWIFPVQQVEQLLLDLWGNLPLISVQKLHSFINNWRTKHSSCAIQINTNKT